MGLVCFLTAAVAAFVTFGVLGLTLTPQDSSIPATGEWGYALIPGAVAVGAFWAGRRFAPAGTRFAVSDGPPEADDARG